MALIKCKECGKEISDKAYTCPNCGCPLETIKEEINEVKNEQKNEQKVTKKTKSNILAGILILIGVPLGSLGIWICLFGIIWALVEISDKEIEDKKWAVISCFVFFIVMIMIFANMGSNINSTTDNSTTSSQDNNSDYVTTIYTADGKQDVYKSDFTLIEEETTGTLNGDVYTIQGKVKQNIEGNYNSLMLSLTMYDSNNNEVRKTTGLIFSNYEGDGIWSFTTSGNDADHIVTSYELDYCYGMNN